jgi:hypothetical protein
MFVLVITGSFAKRNYGHFKRSHTRSSINLYETGNVLNKVRIDIPEYIINSKPLIIHGTLYN